MVNAKQKGSNAEREFVLVLTNKIKGGKFNRVYASGAVGTVLGVPSLMGDINGTVEGIPREFKIEAKTGYSNVKDKACKSLALKKEWLEKIGEEARSNFAIPLIMGKFDNVRSGVKYFIAMDLEVFAELINELAEVSKENGKLIERLEKT